MVEARRLREAFCFQSFPSKSKVPGSVEQSKSTCPGNQMVRNDKQGPEEAERKKKGVGLVSLDF